MITYQYEDKKIEFPWEGEVYEAMICIRYYTDYSYGADVDGNRSSDKTFTDSVEVMEVWDETGESIDFSVEMEEKILEGLL